MAINKWFDCASIDLQKVESALYHYRTNKDELMISEL